MDKKDKRILTLLDENSRMPVAVLAKKLRMSRQAVDYRIRQLVKDKIILEFITLIDFTKFHTNVWHMYVKLQNMNPEIDHLLFSYLNGHEQVFWIAKCKGEWDIIFSAYGNDVFEFDNLIMEFNNRFHHNINMHTITSFIEAYMLSRGHFLNNKRLKKEFIGKRQPVKTDKKDIEILKILANNSRLSSAAIGEKIGLSTKQTIHRIRELENKKVIRAFRLNVDPKSYNFDYYKVCFYAQEYSQKIENSILTWCEENPYTLYFVRKIAPWTFEIEFETPDFKVLNDVLGGLRNKFGDVIKRTEIIYIDKEFKGAMNVLGK